MNRVILIGNLTRDPEYASGNDWTRCKFNIAVTRDKDNTDFLDIIAWDKTADLCNRYLAKGRKVAIEGRVQTNSYKNEDGKTVKFYDIMAHRVEFLSPLEERPQKATVMQDLTPIEDGEVPF
jgi:single-strand DNA-binding protein